MFTLLFAVTWGHANHVYATDNPASYPASTTATDSSGYPVTAYGQGSTWATLTVGGNGLITITGWDTSGSIVTSKSATLSGSEYTFSFDGAANEFQIRADSGGYAWAVSGTINNDPTVSPYDSAIFTIPSPPSSDPAVLNSTLTYLSDRDVYKLSYSGWPSNVSNYKIKFLDVNDNLIEKSYTSSPTGTYILTCNGRYWLEFNDSSGNVVARTDQVTTTEIQNPTCNSYTGDPTVDPTAGDGTGTGSGTGTGTGCAFCDSANCSWDQQVIQTFADTVGQAVAANLPPPPDWPQVAKTFGDELVPRIGEEIGRVLEDKLGYPEAPPPVQTPSVPTFDGTSGVSVPQAQDSTPVAQPIDFSNVESVPVEQDTTGGIDLSGADPTDSLPRDPEGYLPIPGQETGGDKPQQTPIETVVPSDGGIAEQPTDETPIPGNTAEEPPVPIGDGGEVTPPPKPEMPPPS